MCVVPILVCENSVKDWMESIKKVNRGEWTVDSEQEERGWSRVCERGKRGRAWRNSSLLLAKAGACGATLFPLWLRIGRS